MYFFFEHNQLRSRFSQLVLLFAAVCYLIVGSAPLAWAQTSSQTPSPVYWQERIFMIPYRVNPLSNAGNRLDKVELLLSRDGVSNWKTLQQAEPNVQGFRYYAPDDGDYWFALRPLDRQGKPIPSGPVQPQLYVVVDSQEPKLTMTGSLDAGRALGNQQRDDRLGSNRRDIVLRYEASDANLRPASLRVEYQTDGQAWSALTLGEPDVNQPDRIMGRARLPIAEGLKQIKFRASVVDRAGLRARETAEVSLDRSMHESAGKPVEGPLLHAPNSARAPADFENRASPSIIRSIERAPIVDPFESKSSGRQPTLAALDWPAEEGRAGAKTQAFGAPSTFGAPPRKNPYMFAQTGNQQHSSQLGNPARANFAPPLLPSQRGKPFAAPGSNRPVDAATRLVNARTFDLEYDLDSVGPWGVAKVELWGTHNHGQTWESYGTDPDNRSPMRVSVPAAGLYGFRILVDGANGAGSQSPRPGDPPELSVNVDLQPPTAQMHPAEHGRGNLVDHLIIRWTASDHNLEPRPISLFYSAYPNGPWSTVASGLQNTSQYAWRIERHVPEQFYLRLEVRDTAGNLTTSQSPAPVTLNRPQPTGRLRGVRPVASQSGATRIEPQRASVGQRRHTATPHRPAASAVRLTQ